MIFEKLHVILDFISKDVQVALVVMHLRGSAAFWFQVQYLELSKCRLLLESRSIFQADRLCFHD